ncbi:hypothetical protein [Burkholderia puraquae]|uniref:hypothetical protein n=1 Tax=Burkholderia puraquae TaxID=1904757 RepID=UPI0010554E31|nr:hypothetical protein [Burkholderia puraquae]
MRIVDEASVARNVDFPLTQVKHTQPASGATGGTRQPFGRHGAPARPGTAAGRHRCPFRLSADIARRVGNFRHDAPTSDSKLRPR